MKNFFIGVLFWDLSIILSYFGLRLEARVLADKSFQWHAMAMGFLACAAIFTYSAVRFITY